MSSHKPTETEFTAVILKLKNENCDVVMGDDTHRYYFDPGCS